MKQNSIFVNRDGLQIPYSEVLFDTKSKYQRVRILQTNKFGKIIILDDIMFQAEDGDELTEMATHLPLNVGPKKEHISMIGGGDGFALKEIVKHPYIKSIDLVEIDKDLLNASQSIFTFNGAWKDKRLKEFNLDGFDYVKNLKDKKDLIISTPANIYTNTGKENIAFPLFTVEYFKNVYKKLTDDGIFVTDGSTSHYADKEPNWVSIYKDLKTIFPIVYPYFFASKRMPGGSFVLVFASKKYHPIKDYINNSGKIDTRYYNEGIHKTSFSLPQFLINKLE